LIARRLIGQKFEFSTLAVKNTIRDVSDELIQRSRNEMALTMVAAEFAQYATSLEWVDFFDVLLGTTEIYVQCSKK